MAGLTSVILLNLRYSVRSDTSSYTTPGMWSRSLLCLRSNTCRLTQLRSSSGGREEGEGGGKRGREEEREEEREEGEGGGEGGGRGKREEGREEGGREEGGIFNCSEISEYMYSICR